MQPLFLAHRSRLSQLRWGPEVESKIDGWWAIRPNRSNRWRALVETPEE